MLDFFSYTWLHEAIHGYMIQLYKYIASIVYIYSLLNCFDRYVGVLEEVDGGDRLTWDIGGQVYKG